MIELKLNEQQVNLLVGLVDLAVKTGGLQVAPGAMQIVALIQEAIDKANSPKTVIDNEEI